MMKTLVIYASKKGATKKCAEQLKQGIKGEVKLITSKAALNEKVQGYDNVVIGSSIYVGGMDKNVKNFCSENQEDLKGKRVFLFLGCMNDKLLDDYVKNNIPEEMRKNLLDISWCGGAFYFSKMNFFEKFIIKKIANSEKKASGSEERIDGKTDIENFKEENIKKLLQKINSFK